MKEQNKQYQKLLTHSSTIVRCQSLVLSQAKLVRNSLYLNLLVKFLALWRIIDQIIVLLMKNESNNFGQFRFQARLKLRSRFEAIFLFKCV